MQVLPDRRPKHEPATTLVARLAQKHGLKGPVPDFSVGEAALYSGTGIKLRYPHKLRVHIGRTARLDRGGGHFQFRLHVLAAKGHHASLSAGKIAHPRSSKSFAEE